MSRVQIKYSFIFDPNDAFSDNETLELEIAKFFSSKGFQVDLIEAAEEQENIRAFLLTKTAESQEAAAKEEPIGFDKKLEDPVKKIKRIKVLVAKVLNG